MAELTIQPSAKDTNLVENEANRSFGTAGSLLVLDRLGQRQRTVLEFDLSGLPAGATLNSATLQLYYRDKSGAVEGKTIWAYKLTRTDWLEGILESPSTAGATWNDYKIVGETHYQWTTPGGDYVTSSPAGGSAVVPGSYGWISWDVLAIVQDAYDASKPAEFLLRFETEGLEGEDFGDIICKPKEFADEDKPKLVITYTVPGWTGKIGGVTNPAKVMGVDVANIAKVKGVA
ncbi:hypothetical protein ES708_16219 [subsurface metagenome]